MYFLCLRFSEFHGNNIDKLPILFLYDCLFKQTYTMYFTFLNLYHYFVDILFYWNLRCVFRHFKIHPINYLPWTSPNLTSPPLDVNSALRRYVAFTSISPSSVSTQNFFPCSFFTEMLPCFLVSRIPNSNNNCESHVMFPPFVSTLKRDPFRFFKWQDPCSVITSKRCPSKFWTSTSASPVTSISTP